MTATYGSVNKKTWGATGRPNLYGRTGAGVKEWSQVVAQTLARASLPQLARGFWFGTSSCWAFA